ncbi:hypothetical protein XENORESO_011131 [Xenotaenia resolanae]|uniref:Uncharacterized protein n=1 Tax=Xenotaenia resolanae TaxID=208358 RepID=A0ABV0VQ77_9TELE
MFDGRRKSSHRALYLLPTGCNDNPNQEVAHVCYPDRHRRKGWENIKSSHRGVRRNFVVISSLSPVPPVTEAPIHAVTEENPEIKTMFSSILGLVAIWYLYRWYKESKRISNKGDKYVYITGCDSGFGNNLAKHLDKLGFRVIAGCYTERGELELKELSSERLTTISLDVTKSESVKKVAASIKSLVGEKGLWAVVNNAGVATPSGPTEWLTIEDYKSMLAVNLNGVIAVTLSVLPLIKMARGRVVNVASVFGRLSPFGGPYCVSKYGVESFNDNLRLNMAPFGVKVLCIEPGFFKTSMTDTMMLKNNLKSLWDRLSQDMKDEYGEAYLETSEFLHQTLDFYSPGQSFF